MKILPRLGLFTAVALCLTSQAEGQNNLGNLENINAANSIEEASSSKGSRTENNVLNSDEVASSPKTGRKIKGSSQRAKNNSNTSINSGNSGNSAMGGMNNGGGNAGNAGMGGMNNGGGNAGNAGMGGMNNGGGNSGNSAMGGMNNANGGGNRNLGPNTLAGPSNSDAPPQPEGAPLPDQTAGSQPTDTTAAQAPAANEQELSKEEKQRAKLELFRKIAEKIPPLAEGEGPQEYTIQPGDTLWDISDQLLDDPFWWPRLWVLNPEVEDPDLIEPGMKLVFYPSAGDAPDLAIHDGSDPIGPAKVELATLQTFSLKSDRWTGPNGQLVDPTALPGDQHTLIVGDAPMTSTYLFPLPGFLTNEEITPLGEVLSSPNAPLQASQGQKIIAQFDGRAPSPGERFLALRHSPVMGKMDDTKSDMDLYNYVGVVGVVRSSPEGIAVLVAEDGGAQILPADIIVPMNKRTLVAIDPFSAGRPNGAPAYVVATENGSFTFAGPGMAIFLQGIDGRNPFSVGDDVEIFMPNGSINGMGDELVGRDKVALARIVDTTADSAVGVILNSSREVSTGASTRPDLIP
ncbi:MAG: hypothetical protein RIR26_659 [Pseudomonadota bacterium]